MNFIQHVSNKRKEGVSNYDVTFFSIHPDSTRRYMSESLRTWETECGLLCDDPTYEYIKEHCVNNIFVITDEFKEEVKQLHFYKEVILSY